MKHVTVDPVTRIEGHLRVEVQVDEATGKVTDALSSGTAWRGLELVMNDRDPRDAWAYIQRICGVCTTAHALASVRAVEDALGIRIPPNANYIRNIMAACLTVQDHIVHFYHLHALDWVSPVEALAADPAAAAKLQSTLLTMRLPFAGPAGLDTEAYPKDFPNATPEYFAAFKKKIEQIVQSGQLGIFSANWWDHPDYKLLPPEVHLIAVVHYLELLDKHREIVTPHVVFGGKNPHPHYVVGGMPCAISLDDGNAPVNTARLAIVDRAVNLTRTLVNEYYIPDVLAIGAAYVKAGKVDGGGLAKHCVLAFGQFPEEGYTGTRNGDFMRRLLIRSNGVVENFGAGLDVATFTPIRAEDLSDPVAVTEGIEHSWYEYEGEEGDLHPWAGQTKPKYTAPKVGTMTNWSSTRRGNIPGSRRRNGAARSQRSARWRVISSSMSRQRRGFSPSRPGQKSSCSIRWMPSPRPSAWRPRCGCRRWWDARRRAHWILSSMRRSRSITSTNLLQISRAAISPSRLRTSGIP